MSEEFSIPSRPDALEAADGRYGVSAPSDFATMSEAAVVSALEDAREQADAAPPDAAFTERETLSAVYSALRAFGSLSPKAIELLRVTLVDATERLLVVVRRVAKPNAAASDHELLEPRSALKLHTFLLSWLLTSAAARDDEAAPASRAAPAKGGKGKSAATAAAGRWDRMALLESVAIALVGAAECELAALWGLGAPDEPFLQLLTRGACAVLERPDLAKAAALRRPALELLACVGGRYGQRVAVVTCAVDLLHKCEHATSALVELVSRLSAGAAASAGDAEGQAALLSELVGELAMSAGATDSGDSAAARGVAAFLVEASEKAPAALLPHLDLVASQLAAESYTVRSGVVHALGLLLIHVQEERRSLSSDASNAALSAAPLGRLAGAILSLLIERILDASSYTRSRTLQAWAMAVESRAVPPSAWPALCDAVAGRLRDKAANVRKNALVLLRAMAAFNPFAPTLDALTHGSHEATLSARLAAMAADAEGAGDKEEGEGGEPEQTEGGAPAAPLESEADQAFWAAPLPAQDGPAGERAKCARALALCRAAVALASAFDAVLDETDGLLASATTSDVAEALLLLETLARFRVARAERQLIGALPLATSKEPAVRAALAGAIGATLLSEGAPCSAAAGSAAEKKEKGGAGAAAARAAATKLVGLFRRMTLGERAALESLLPELLGVSIGGAGGGGATEAFLPPGVLAALWDVVGSAGPAAASGAARGAAPSVAAVREAQADGAAALELLLIAEAAAPDVMRGRADRLLAVALAPPYSAPLASAGCAALRAANASGSVPTARAVGALRALLAWEPPDASSNETQWYGCAQRALDCLFELAPRPELQLAAVVRLLHARALGRAGASGGADARSAVGGEDEAEAEAGAGQAGGGSLEVVRPAALCRLLAVVGHGAICALVRSERFERDLKKARAARADGEDAAAAGASKGKEAGKSKVAGAARKGAASATGGRKGSKAAAAANEEDEEEEEATEADESNLERELGARAEADEADSEALRLLADADVLGWQPSSSHAALSSMRAAAAAAKAGGPASSKGLLGSYAPLVEALAAGRVAGADGSESVRVASALALAQMMVASPAYCEAQLPLFFSLLLAAAAQPQPAAAADDAEAEGTADDGDDGDDAPTRRAFAAAAAARGAKGVPAALRRNLAVSLGDLSVRYPNLLEPWTAHVHRALRDPDASVRATVLSVVAHLTVHDMVKAKAGGAELALCLLDSDAQVVRRARLLFTELSLKSSAPIYNMLPELLSKLAAADAPVNHEEFRKIFGFLFGFVDKDKQAEALADRLCGRLAAAGADDVRSARSVAFCLEKLPPTDKALRRLIERRSAYAHRLSDDEVYASMCEVAAKARRTGKAPLIQAADEYEATLEQLRERALRGGDADEDGDCADADGLDDAVLGELMPNGTPARGARPKAGAASASKTATVKRSAAKPRAKRAARA